VFPLSRLLKKDPYEIGALPDGLDSFSKDKKNKEESIQPADFSLLQTLRTKTFWLITFVWLFQASNMFLVFTHLVPHVTDIGFSAGEAAAVLSLVGGLSVVGRVLMGTVSDRIGRKPTAIICALLQAGALVWLTWSQDLWMFYLFALFYGLAYGGLGPSIAALIGDTFGLRNMGAILGALDIGFGVGGALGPAIGGLIFDATNSYFMAFLLGAVVMFISALLIAVIRRETS